MRINLELKPRRQRTIKKKLIIEGTYDVYFSSLFISFPDSRLFVKINNHELVCALVLERKVEPILRMQHRSGLMGTDQADNYITRYGTLKDETELTLALCNLSFYPKERLRELGKLVNTAFFLAT